MTGKVLKLHADGRAFMDFGQFRAHARIPWSVLPGQAIDLEIVETGLPLKLRALSRPASTSKPAMPNIDFANLLSGSDQNRMHDLIDRILSSPGSARVPQRILTALSHVKLAFQPASLPTDTEASDLIQRLRLTVEQSGLLFEKKMAEVPTSASHANGGPTAAQSIVSQDLKAHLLILKAFFESSEAKTVGPADFSDKALRFMQRMVERMLTHVEDQQTRLSARLAENDPVLEVHHQFYLENRSKPVHLKLYYPKKERSQQSPEQYRLALLLNMDLLGSVRIDLAMLGDILEIGFYVENEKARDMLDQQKQKLLAVLEGGFDKVNLAVRVSEMKIEQFLQKDPLDLASGRIDIQI